MTNESSNNQETNDLDDNVSDLPTPRPQKMKKPMNLSSEERAKRSERMKKLRAKLDNLGSKPVGNFKQETKKKPTTSMKEAKTTKKEEPIDNTPLNSDESEISSEESEVEEQKPLPKQQKIKKTQMNSKRKIKPTPRKVMKIKYYEEPSPAEMLQDRLFLENQHKQDYEQKYSKPTTKKYDDFSNQMFNY